MEADYTVDHQKYESRLSRLMLHSHKGKVSKSVGLIVEASLAGAAIGSICDLQVSPEEKPILAEVIGFNGSKVVLMPLEETQGISRLSVVRLKSKSASVRVSNSLLGRVVDGVGNPIDGKGEITDGLERSLYAESINPLDRKPISQPLDLGIRAINGLITCGSGQRMGIMAGSGVGKSVLLGMMARYTSADVNVIALVGERGREVREYIENDLGEEGLARSVIIVATSDQSPLLRKRAAFIATTIAEFFADQGKNVLLMMDSLTRFSMAQREIGLSLGEPPAAKGYTPSVFATLPRLLERAGNRADGRGSITGLYTVLVEGDDLDEPIADATRAILDGHIVLSRQLADRGHYPAIDVLASVSRVMRNIVSDDHNELSSAIREVMAIYNDSEDLINIGAYVSGTNPTVDRAIVMNEYITKMLQQKIEDRGTIGATTSLMRSIVKGDR